MLLRLHLHLALRSLLLLLLKLHLRCHIACQDGLQLGHRRLLLLPLQVQLRQWAAWHT